MSQRHVPAGWDEARVQRVIDHYENMNDDELLAEDQAARKAGKSHLPVAAAVAKVRGKTKGSRRQKKRKQPKTLPPSKRAPIDGDTALKITMDLANGVQTEVRRL